MKNTLGALLLFAGFAMTNAARAEMALTVGTITAKPGEKVSGWLEVPAGADPDGKNLNRMYPRNPNGTISERIAHVLTRDVIEKCTHLVDLHCGDGNESLRPYSYWMTSGNDAVDKISREMNLAFGLDHIVIDNQRSLDAKKSVYTSRANSPAPGSAEATCAPGCSTHRIPNPGCPAPMV